LAASRAEKRANVKGEKWVALWVEMMVVNLVVKKVASMAGLLAVVMVAWTD